MKYLSLTGLSAWSMFFGKPGAYSRVEHLKIAPLGYALALLTNIKLGWKGLPETDTLVDCERT